MFTVYIPYMVLSNPTHLFIVPVPVLLTCHTKHATPHVSGMSCGASRLCSLGPRRALSSCGASARRVKSARNRSSPSRMSFLQSGRGRAFVMLESPSFTAAYFNDDSMLCISTGAVQHSCQAFNDTLNVICMWFWRLHSAGP